MLRINLIRGFALLLFILNTTTAFAQNFEVTVAPTHSLEEVLASHGVTDLSEPSLIAALLHSDPQVRTIAAMKLGEQRHDDALPAVEAALVREKDLHAQIGLAEALWEFHDEKGAAHLHAMCTDSSLNFPILISVIDALQITRSPAGVCAETFFAAMGESKEAGEIAMGMTRLSVIYCDCSPQLARRILSTLRFYLADGRQDATIRMNASQALANIGTPECEEAIRAAIAQEPTSDYRVFFEATLKGLHKNPHYCDNIKPSQDRQ